jgi:YesN/AraC family two-component response regulator
LTPIEISSQVGFSDHKYFSKCFAKEFGKTPSEFLNEYNKIDEAKIIG